MYLKYGFLGTIKMLVAFIYTRLAYPKARLIRLPFDIRNRRFIDLGRGLTTGVGCRIEAYSSSNKVTLIIGNNVQMNDYVHITAMDEVRIGNNVLLASKIYISDCSHGSYVGDADDSSPLSIPKDRNYAKKKVIIEDNVWLGEFACVLPGVTIGRGTIVGANSVVTKSLPANVIAVGAPARPIKKYNFDTQRWEFF